MRPQRHLDRRPRAPSWPREDRASGESARADEWSERVVLDERRVRSPERLRELTDVGGRDEARDEAEEDDEGDALPEEGTVGRRDGSAARSSNEDEEEEEERRTWPTVRR